MTDSSQELEHSSIKKSILKLEDMFFNVKLHTNSKDQRLSQTLISVNYKERLLELKLLEIGLEDLNLMKSKK